MSGSDPADVQHIKALEDPDFAASMSNMAGRAPYGNLKGAMPNYVYDMGADAGNSAGPKDGKPAGANPATKAATPQRGHVQPPRAGCVGGPAGQILGGMAQAAGGLFGALTGQHVRIRPPTCGR